MASCSISSPSNSLEALSLTPADMVILPLDVSAEGRLARPSGVEPLGGLGFFPSPSGVPAPGFIFVRNLSGDMAVPSLPFLSFTLPRSTFVLPLALQGSYFWRNS